jgi:hypothetical protein
MILTFLKHQIIKILLWIKSFLFKDMARRQKLRELINEIPSHFDHAFAFKIHFSVVHLARLVGQTCRLEKFECQMFIVIG